MHVVHCKLSCQPHAPRSCMRLKKRLNDQAASMQLHKLRHQHELTWILSRKACQIQAHRTRWAAASRCRFQPVQTSHQAQTSCCRYCCHHLKIGRPNFRQGFQTGCWTPSQERCSSALAEDHLLRMNSKAIAST